MPRQVLITGGAGFIGSHLVDALLRDGHAVRVLDNLDAQVHGADAAPPEYLDAEVEFQQGDVRDRHAVRAALKGVDVVYHLAAAVGVGQSMYEMRHYMDVNTVGTSVLLEAILHHPIERLVVASSMSLYGEGLYCDTEGAVVENAARDPVAVRQGHWEPTNADGTPLTPLPTPEWKKPALASVYALSKHDQERLCLMAGNAYGFDAVALRFFNAYGPRQALSNPYTGVLAIFGSRLLNGRPPLLFEDGAQRRDFVSVYDVAEACRLAMACPEAAGQAINIGSGISYSVREVVAVMQDALHCQHLEPQVTEEFRVGDIRHCFADIERARDLLGYRPRVELGAGVAELAQWMQSQSADDHVDQMRAELSQRGLTLSR